MELGCAVAGKPFSPYEGANDLNADAATQLDGVLFMEGEAEPGEIKRLKRDLREYGTDAADAGEWLATAMTSAWAVAAALLDIDGLADLLGERHRIIANNWQAAALMTLASHVLERAAETLDRVDFAPASLSRRSCRPRRVGAPRVLGGRDDRPRRRPAQRLRPPGA